MYESLPLQPDALFQFRRVQTQSCTSNFASHLAQEVLIAILVEDEEVGPSANVISSRDGNEQSGGLLSIGYLNYSGLNGRDRIGARWQKLLSNGEIERDCGLHLGLC